MLSAPTEKKGCWSRTFSSTHATSSAANLLFPCSSSALNPPVGTIYALGSSVASSRECTPMTAASPTLGFVSRSFSRSAGGTWKPLYLMSSFRRSTMLSMWMNNFSVSWVSLRLTIRGRLDRCARCPPIYTTHPV
jgi:hypothetical protein